MMKRLSTLLILVLAVAASTASADCILKQSTATQNVLIGPFLDDTDGNTPEVGLTIANTDIRLSKAGANIVAKNSGGGTHDELGMYQITLDATDTNTVGSLDIIVAETGALIVWKECQVLEEAVYDNMYASAAVGPLTAAQVNTEVDTGLTDYDAVVPADLPTNFADLSITASTGRVDVASVAGTAQTANDNGADINAILTDTGTTIPAVLGTPTDFGSGTSTLAANLQDIADNGTAAFDRSTDSLQAIRDRGDAAWTTGSGTGLTALASGTAQSGTASTIVLASGESFADDILNGNSICLNSGTGDGQCRTITDYAGASDTATVSPNWTTNPDATSVYEVYVGSANVVTVALTAQTANDNSADINTLITNVGTPTDLGGGATLSDNNSDMAGATFATATDSQEAIRDRGDAAWTTGSGTGLTALATGTAQGGSASTIQLAAGETFADNILNGNSICITGGTGAGQCRVIIDYTGSTDTATTTPAWTTNPSTDSTYEVYSGSINAAAWQGAAITTALETSADIADAVLDEDLTGHQTTGSLGAAIGDGDAGAGMTEAGGTGDQLTAVPWNAAWDAEAQSEAADALTAYDPPTDTEMDTQFADIDTLVGTPVADLATDIATVDTNVDSLVSGTILATGTCDSGTTTTCVDAALTQADDYWKGAAIIFTNGSISGQSSCVFDFAAATDTLTFRARTAAVGTNTYLLVENSVCEGVVSP